MRFWIQLLQPLLALLRDPRNLFSSQENLKVFVLRDVDLRWPMLTITTCQQLHSFSNSSSKNIGIVLNLANHSR